MENLRIGMVGLDTSHCTAFCDLLNLPDHPYHVAGGRVICAYPGGSQEFSLSRERVAGFTQQVQEKHGVKIVDSIAAVAEAVDAVLLESVDGRQHLEQFAQLAPYKKPVFIDKPLATSTADTRAIFDLARRYGTPVFSSSSLRYAGGITGLEGGQAVLGCEICGPMSILPDYPGLFWYGVHIAEILFAKMGTGCRTVQVIKGKDADVVVGTWADGRIGSMYGFRNIKRANWGATVFTTEGIFQAVAQHTPPHYASLLPQVIRFFQTGQSPVAEAEMLEIMAFLEAGSLSYETGAPVQIQV